MLRAFTNDALVGAINQKSIKMGEEDVKVACDLLKQFRLKAAKPWYDLVELLGDEMIKTFTLLAMNQAGGMFKEIADAIEHVTHEIEVNEKLKEVLTKSKEWEFIGINSGLEVMILFNAEKKEIYILLVDPDKKTSMKIKSKLNDDGPITSPNENDIEIKRKN